MMKKIYLVLSLLILSVFSFAQGTETCTNIATTVSSYLAVSWTGDNGLAWTSSDTRTDQTINGKAVGVRNGTVACNNIPNGIASISFQAKYLFTGSAASLTIKINGTALLTTISVPSTQTTATTYSISNINTSGAFNLEIVQTTSGARVAIDDITWTAYNSNLPNCVAPTAQPTLNSPTSTVNTASFNIAPVAADGYLTIISTSPTLSATPVDGVTYTDGQSFGGGTVSNVGANTNITEIGLTPATVYYFFVIPYNNTNCAGGPAYFITGYPTISITTATPPACVAPSAATTSISFTATNSAINGSFPAVASADGYLVTISPAPLTGFTPANGTTYTVGQTVGNGTVVKFGTGTTFSASSLNANTVYYFNVFSLNTFSCIGGPRYFATAFASSFSTNNSTSNQPLTYYNTTVGLSCAPLKTELKTIITNGMTPKSYANLYDWLQTNPADLKPREVGSGSTNVIWDIYSDRPGPSNDPYNFNPATRCGNYTNEGDCWNREHSVPQSWFGANANSGSVGPESDCFHIFPTDGKVNSVRSNFIYGEVATATTTSLNGSKLGSSAFAGLTGTVFEPLDEYKGDVARAFLYFVTRYENNMSGYPASTTSSSPGAQAFEPNTFPSIDVNFLRLMLKWHNNDPVSQKERDRNNEGYNFQVNRNPYVDSPQFVSRVWNASCPNLGALPVDILLFGGKLNGNKINLRWDVANELNFLQYEIERSFNGINFERIATVKAVGNSSYVYADDVTNISGRRVYYRLKKVDKDGQYQFSKIFTMHIPMNIQFTVLPNPVTNVLVMQFNQVIDANATLQIVDLSGRLLKQLTVAGLQQNIQIDVQDLAAGTYVIRLVNQGQNWFQRFQKM
jgi:endonuclease I